jgi:hypothetical protein
VLFRNEDPHQARLGELAVELARERVLAVPARDVRGDLALRDLGGQRADGPLLLG